MPPSLNNLRYSFLSWFSIVLLSTLLVVGLFNLIIDPFSLYHLIRLEGINQKKPEFSNHLRMAKAHAVRCSKPNGIILGSSRAEVGLDPEHSSWPDYARPVYNLGLSEAKIFEVSKYLKHAYYQSGLKLVIIGLDFTMFHDLLKHQKDFNETRLRKNSDLTLSSGWISDLISSTSSMYAIKKSLLTINSQNMNDTSLYLDNGMRNFHIYHIRVQSKGGNWGAEMTIHKELTSAFKRIAEYDNSHFQMEKSLTYFSEMIDFLIAHRIKTYLFISPVHARYLERIKRYNLWDDYEIWKKSIVNIVHDKLITQKETDLITLWDFGGYHSISCEPFPKQNNTNVDMKWYWESSHYKKEVGDIILSQLFENEDRKGKIPPDFGIKLTKENIDRHLKRIRSNRKEYIKNNWTDIKDIWNDDSESLVLK